MKLLPYHWAIAPHIRFRLSRMETKMHSFRFAFSFQTSRIPPHICRNTDNKKGRLRVQPPFRGTGLYVRPAAGSAHAKRAHGHHAHVHLGATHHVLSHCNAPLPVSLKLIRVYDKLSIKSIDIIKYKIFLTLHRGEAVFNQKACPVSSGTGQVRLNKPPQGKSSIFSGCGAA